MWQSPNLADLHKARTALALAKSIRFSLKSESDAPLSSSEAFMLFTQMRSLNELLNSDLQVKLRVASSPFASILGSEFGAENPVWKNRRAIADGLSGLITLLESEQAFHEKAEDYPTRSVNAGEGSANGAKDDTTEAALWRVSEKLYQSRQVYALLLLVGLAIVCALGGSFVIGGQTLNVRQQLDQATASAQKEINEASEATRKRLSDMEGLSFASFHDKEAIVASKLQQAEQEVLNLSLNSQKIKDDIVEKLQGNLKTEETKLRDAVLEPLAKLRDTDAKRIADAISKLEETVKAANAQANTESGKLAALGPSLDLLRGYAEQSNKIGPMLSALRNDSDAAHASRLEAEAAANVAKTKQKESELAASGAGQQRDQVAGMVKSAADESQRHARALAVIENQLKDLETKRKDLDGRLKEVDTRERDLENRQKDQDGKSKNSDLRLQEWEKTQKALEGRITLLTNQVGAEEKRLQDVMEKINKLQKDSQITPAKPVEPIAPQPPLKPFEKLTSEEIAQIQRRLKQEVPEVNVGDPDGLPGKLFTAAVRAYQRKIKAKDDGKLTPEQIAILLKPS